MVIRGKVVAISPNKEVYIKTRSRSLTVPFDIPEFTSLAPNVVNKEVFLSKTRTSKGPQEFAILYDIFTPLADLSSERYSITCALLVKAYSPVKSKGTDYFFTLTIRDETDTLDLRIFTSSIQNIYTMLIRYDESEQKELRNLPFEGVYKPGDIFIIQNIKRTGKERIAIVHKGTVLHRLGNIHDNQCPETELAPALLNNCKLIKNFSITRKNLIIKYFKDLTGKQQSQISKRSEVEIKNLALNKYFDITAKVVYMEQGSPPLFCVTDYTVNPLLSSRKGGKYRLNMLLYVKAYGKYADLANKMKLGKVYQFKNIKVASMNEYAMAYLSDGEYGGIVPEEDTEVIKRINKREEEYFQEEGECEEDRFVGARCRCGKGVCEGVVRPEEKICGCSKEEPLRMRIADAKSPGMYVIRSQMKIGSENNDIKSWKAVICDGVDIIWADIWVDSPILSKKKRIEPGHWYWALILIADSAGSNNLLVDAENEDKYALKWIEYIKREKELNSIY